ncbi:uncharacterized protein LOC143484626 [Brachyhypopomus gauderio]|uniref:uncharacterized protein LOC143484626 n=1 Tax=Brachyhypopomus gauderio TaxID=698409 RepID=UPI0040423EAA
MTLIGQGVSSQVASGERLLRYPLSTPQPFLKPEERRMEDHKNVPWSNAEVQTFLQIIGDQKIQGELDGATRNVKVFSEVSALMATHGYQWSVMQCRSKLKKLKSDYRAVKDHNGRSGANRKDWKWFQQMDAIYGHRPASNGRENVLDTAMSVLEATENDSPSTDEASTPLEPPASPASYTEAAVSTPSGSQTPVRRPNTGKRKRTQTDLDICAHLLEMQAQDVRMHEQMHEQREEHIQLLLRDSREAREQEAELRRAELAENASFNRAFLGVFGELVKTLRDRHQ